MSYYSIDWHKFVTTTVLPGQIFGNRPHVHGTGDVVGLRDDIGYEVGIRPVKAHTHLNTDVVGLGDQIGAEVGLRSQRPHRHNYVDLAGNFLILGNTILSNPSGGQLSLSTGTQFLVPDGAAATPSIAFNTATNNGFYNAGSGALGWSFAGNAALIFANSTTTGLALHASFPLTWGSSGPSAPDVKLYRDGSPGVLAQRNGVNAQEFRLYNTFTSATSFERLGLRWSANELLLGNEKGSAGGTQRKLVIGGALGTDNSFAVRAGSAQAANLQEWQNSSGAVLSRIDPGGQTTDWVLVGQVFGP